MTPGLPAQPLRGIIPPMVTPLLDPGTLDLIGLERLIEHMIAGGVHGLFVLGSTGEGPNLSDRVRRELIHATCERVAGRVPVLVCMREMAAGK
jgi:4-hydroxy-tetrahydrodipicolinate synthase